MLRDFFVELALTEIVEARWTDEIHSEWMRNVLENRPDITLDRLTRTQNLMDFYVKNSLVTDYEEIIPQLELPDEKDRHVLAAAIKSNAKFIITFNLRDFPSNNLRAYNIQAMHPDSFLRELLKTDDRKSLSSCRKTAPKTQKSTENN